MSAPAFPADEPAVVTCGLPYANGDLHIGHLRTYLSGDAYARALRTLGQDTAFVCGSDMHGTAIAVAADEAGVDPAEFALDWHETYAETFPQFDVAFDNYGHTDDDTNRELTREFVETWIDGDHVHFQEIEVAYDPVADQSLPDRYVEGTCPYCGERARGDECDEGCQRHLEPGEIEEPTSTLTGNPAEYRTREHAFLRLSDFQDYLQEFVDRLEGTPSARNQPREWIDGELQDLCITRDMDWGFDYPGGREDLVLYVWVDAPIEYVASTKQYSERVGSDTYDWEAVWKGESTPGPAGTIDGGEIVHVIGRDIIQHHTVFWPTMLRAAGYNEPRAVMASGFVTLEGAAFSTSRNRAVWADDYLDADLSPDFLRYYLTTTTAFGDDVDFSWDRFQERVNSDLADTVGNFAYRSLLFAHREFGGTPDCDMSDEVADRIDAAIDQFAAGVNDYALRDVGDAAVDLARFGNEYIQNAEPWHLVDEDPDAAATVIRDCVGIANAVAVLLAPLAPRLADDLWAQLGRDGSVHDAPLGAAREAPGAFDEPDELVEQIEDDQVGALNRQLAERVAESGTEPASTTAGSDASGASSEEGAGAAEATEGAGAGDSAGDADATAADGAGSGGAAVEELDLEPLTEERIDFETFQDLDLRVGEVVDAEPIADADELLRVTVDCGVGTRQVVAGLRQHYDVDELPGTRVIVLVNLEPTELFGVESNGMVLAAGDEADLLTVLGDAPPGTRVR
jgi:methionyl-tRNA synthetase